MAFILHGAQLLSPPLYLLKGCQGLAVTINWTPLLILVFKAVKQAFVGATLLTYPTPNASTRLMVDVSDSALEAVLRQHTQGTWARVVSSLKS